MAKFDLRQWAVKGAEQRLVELAEEAKAIFAEFPELRRRGEGPRQVSAATADQGERAPRRKRRKMSASARKRISDAQKARWAKRKAAQVGSKEAGRAASKAKARQRETR